jgi:hypothetical protein
MCNVVSHVETISMKNMSSLLKPITLALIVILLVLTSACAQKTADTPATQLQIIEHTMSFYNFGDVLRSVVAVDGKAKNVSNTTINTAIITVNFFDKDNNRLNTATAVKSNVAAGELWYFNVRFISPDAWKTVRYDISVTTK